MKMDTKSNFTFDFSLILKKNNFGFSEKTVQTTYFDILKNFIITSDYPVQIDSLFKDEEIKQLFLTKKDILEVVSISLKQGIIIYEGTYTAEKSNDTDKFKDIVVLCLFLSNRLHELLSKLEIIPDKEKEKRQIKK